MHMVVHVRRDLCYRFTSVGMHFFLRMPTISILFFLLKQRFQLALFLFTKERVYILYYFVFGTTKLPIVDFRTPRSFAYQAVSRSFLSM